MFIIQLILLISLTLLLCDRCVGSIHTKTSTSNRENIDAVVPNLLHYVHLNKGDLSFFVLVNIQTAIINLHPDTVYIYTLYAPQGKYWDIMLSAGNVIVEVVETPISIWGHVPGPTDFAHMSDIIRMKALMQRGGIYLDTDMVVFASFDAFRTEPFTIGFCKEFGNARVFSNSVVIAQNSSVFLQLWYDSYKNVNFKCWDCHSSRVPYRLTRKTHINALPYTAFNRYQDPASDTNHEHLFWNGSSVASLSTPWEVVEGVNFAQHLWHAYSQIKSRAAKVDVKFVCQDNAMYARMVRYALNSSSWLAGVCANEMS